MLGIGVRYYCVMDDNSCIVWEVTETGIHIDNAPLMSHQGIGHGKLHLFGQVLLNLMDGRKAAIQIYSQKYWMMSVCQKNTFCTHSHDRR